MFLVDFDGPINTTNTGSPDRHDMARTKPYDQQSRNDNGPPATRCTRRHTVGQVHDDGPAAFGHRLGAGRLRHAAGGGTIDDLERIRQDDGPHQPANVVARRAA